MVRLVPQLASNEDILKAGSAQMRVDERGGSMICRYVTVQTTCEMNAWKFPFDKVNIGSLFRKDYHCETIHNK